MLNALGALSPTQLAILIVVIAVVVLIIAGNIVLSYFRHKNSVRTLCTQQLQQKRNELLARLEEVKSGKLSAGSEADEEEDDSLTEEDDDDGEDDGEEVPAFPEIPSVRIGGEDGAASYEILAVKDMPDEMRAKYGLDHEEDRNKRYFVHYTYGFDAKLRSADREVQKRYAAFVNEVRQYKGVRIMSSFKQQRICKDKSTIGLILFQGKTLCVAFALDPANFAETKYHGIDRSGTKRFADTPMLLKLTSERKLEYAKYLLVQVAYANTILLNETLVETEYDFTPKSNEELFFMNAIRIRFAGEVPDSETDTAERAEKSEAIGAIEKKRLELEEQTAGEEGKPAEKEAAPADALIK